jgi:hypothetical protein
MKCVPLCIEVPRVYFVVPGSPKVVVGLRDQLMVASVITNVQVYKIIEAVVGKVVSNAGLAMAAHLNGLSTAFVEELTAVTAASATDKLEEKISNAAEITQGIKDEAMKLVKNAHAQKFKKTYRVWNLIKDTPSRVLADIALQLPDRVVDSAVCDQVSKCGDESGATLLYAVLAITQNCLRARKPGEVAKQLHDAARECAAVKEIGIKLPPKFAAILASA